MEKEKLLIHNLFDETACSFPDKIAAQFKKDNQWFEFSYRRMRQSALSTANFLRGEGLQKGERAALILENRPEWAIIYLGIMYAGLACVPIDPQLNAAEIKNLISDSGARVIFSSENIFQEKIKEGTGVSSIKIIVLDSKGPAEGISSFSEIERLAALTENLPEVLPEDIASLIYTSGTTGQPKGVLLSHKNICSNFKSISRHQICFPSDNILSILPLYHTYAFMVTLVMPLFLGAKITYAYSFKPQELSQIIKEGKVTVLVGVPQLFSLLHRAIFEKIKKIPPLLSFLLLPFIKQGVSRKLGVSLRLFVSGGARLEAKIARDFARLGLKLIEGYGLTETSPVVTLNPPEKLKFGSVGKPVSGVEIKILNPDACGVGQVLIKGPNVMQGYFRQPEMTAQVIKDSWFYSGDLGYIDKEGYLFLTGREKDVIVLSSGKNIYPEELEAYYSQSPYIKEICILSRQEKRFGKSAESLYAVVVPNLEQFQKQDETDVRGKIRWEIENLSKNIPSYKHIMGFALTKEELPRTALKKIKRYQVKEKYLAGGLEKSAPEAKAFSGEDLKIIRQEGVSGILEYISREVNKPVSLDSHLEIDLGIDSLSRVELGLGLEALCKIKIPDELLYGAATVRELILKLSGLGRAAQPQAEAAQADKAWQEILSAPLSEEVTGKIMLRAGLLDKLITWLFKSILLFIFRVFWFLKIEIRSLLPAQGAYLLCPNHASYLDAFVVFSSLGFRAAVNIFFLGYSKIFEHPSVRWAMKIARLVPIDATVHLTEAMQAVAFVLRQKKIACIFPEGRRSVNENIGEFKKGVGILIKELDIPVIPVYIKGSHYSWPRGSFFPRPCLLKIVFGRAFGPGELIEQGKKAGAVDDYSAIALALREEVLKLSC